MNLRRTVTAAVVVLGFCALWVGACDGQQTPGPAPAPAPTTPMAPLTPPSAPLNLTASTAGETAIDLQWTAPAADTGRHPATGYRIEWSADGAAGWAPVEPPHTGVSTQYRHEGLLAATTRHYRVFALSAGGDSPASNTASASTEEPPAVTVVFVDRTLIVPEGRNRSLGVFYRVTDLDAPLLVAVSASGGSVADYELSGALLSIPAGSDLEGTLEVEFSALDDDSFAEGDEEIRLRLSAETREGARIMLGDDLSVLIEDSRVMPCAGIALGGTPPEPDEGAERIRTTLTSEWREAARSVSMEWLGPYQEWRNWYISFTPGQSDAWEDTKPHPANHAFHIESWRTEPGTTVSRHIMEVSWPTGTTLGLMFRCGDRKVITACRAEGCSIQR